MDVFIQYDTVVKKNMYPEPNNVSVQCAYIKETLLTEKFYTRVKTLRYQYYLYTNIKCAILVRSNSIKIYLYFNIIIQRA